MNEKDNAWLERGADNDIVRLRWRLKIRENIIGRLVADNQRLRLTDAERDAIGDMIHLIECQHEDYGREAATLRSLLARLS